MPDKLQLGTKSIGHDDAADKQEGRSHRNDPSRQRAGVSPCLPESNLLHSA